MRRGIIALLVCLLLPASALAFDVSAYMLAPTGTYDTINRVLPVSRSEYLRQHVRHMPDGTTIHALERWKDGAQVFQTALPQKENTGFTSFLWRDGCVGLLEQTDRIEGTQVWKKDYTLFDLTGGTLTNPRSFEGAPYMLKPFWGGFAGVCDDEEHAALLLYDEQAQLRLRHPLPFSDARIQAAFMQDGAVFALILQQGMLPDVIALRIGADNTVTWTYTDAKDAYYYNALHTDGQGGALLTGSLKHDHKQYRITHLSAEGQNDWNKTLRAKNAVVSPRLVVPRDDGTITLYGRAIAVSRDLYTVFAMHMDAAGRVYDIDVRDCSSSKCTEPQIELAADGTVFVLADDVHGQTRETMLVPFDALPKAKNPGITLK